MSSVYIFGSSHFCNRDSGEQCDDGLTQRSRSAADQSQLPSAGTANYKDEMGVEGARKAIRCAQIDHCVRLHRTNERTNTLTVPSFLRSLQPQTNLTTLLHSATGHFMALWTTSSSSNRLLPLLSALADSINKFSIPFMPHRFGELHSRRSPTHSNPP